MDTSLGRNLRNACMGWNLQDDTFGDAIGGGTCLGFHPFEDVDKWRTLIKAAQDAQMARNADGTPIPGKTPINLPFFFNWEIGFTWYLAPDGAWSVFSTPQPDPSGPPRYRWYDLPLWMKMAIRRVSHPDGGAFPDDAVRVLLPYSYPWNAVTPWNYRTLPPGYSWKEVIRSLDEDFPFVDPTDPSNPNKANKDLQIQPILECGKCLPAVTNPPGHADMHKQVRVLLDMGPKNRITALWFAAWTVSEYTWQSTAKQHWTTASTYKERWAEAIQTEIGDEATQPTTEAIGAAKPDTTELLPLPVTSFVKGGNVRIPYQLHQKGTVRIRIERLSGMVRGSEHRRRFLGESPAGYYKRDPAETLTDENSLWGTSAHWDGRDDGVIGGVVRPESVAGHYRVRLFVNGFEVTGSPRGIEIEEP